MPTRTELASRVMVRMGVLDAGENPTPKEANDVIDVMNSVYLSLKERGRIHWSLDAIPTQFIDPFINVVADRASPDFGINDATLNQRAQLGLKEIFALSARDYDGRADEVVDF